MTSKLSNPKDIIGTKKLSLSSLPMAVIAETAVAMTEGAAKYGRHNYRAVGVRASVYYDATMRHLLAWWDEGQDIDPDSGLHHVTKTITSLMVLRDAMIQGKVEDDRPPSSEAFMERLNKATAEVLEKYKDKNPKHYVKNENHVETARVPSYTIEPQKEDKEAMRESGVKISALTNKFMQTLNGEMKWGDFYREVKSIREESVSEDPANLTLLKEVEELSQALDAGIVSLHKQEENKDRIADIINELRRRQQ